jgi:prephenate dehydrogenase
MCSVIIVSVPIGVTCRIIREIGPLMPRDSLLMDLTSIKTVPVQAMLESSVCDVIGLHPLFGPTVTSLAGQNIVLCPARGVRWLQWVREILVREGACLTETTPERHDDMMAIIQGLNHFDTIALGLVLNEMEIDQGEFEHFSTPIFRRKKEIIDAVFAHPRLHVEIIAANLRGKKILTTFLETLMRLRDLIDKGNSEGLIQWMGDGGTGSK